VAVLLSVVCDVCSSEYRTERAAFARADGPARARAAVHGWTTAQLRGETRDVCPRCLQALVPAPEQVAERVLVGAAPQAPRSPAAPAHHTLLEVKVCDLCADGEHRRCRGCDCRVCG